MKGVIVLLIEKVSMKCDLGDTVGMIMAQNIYNLKIIEDSPVPLSAGTKDYSGIATVIVLVCFLAALIIMYGIWFRNHKKRIVELSVMGIDGNIDISGMDEVSIFHPIRTIRFENELENQVVAGTAKGV